MSRRFPVVRTHISQKAEIECKTCDYHSQPEAFQTSKAKRHCIEEGHVVHLRVIHVYEYKLVGNDKR
jgi:hypothetical protein